MIVRVALFVKGYDSLCLMGHVLFRLYLFCDLIHILFLVDALN